MVKRSYIVLVIVVAAAAVIALQVFATWRTSEHARSIVAEISSLKGANLTEEKTRGEIAQIRLRNELDQFFWRSLITSLLPLASAGVALVGAWIGLRKYLDTREKERLDRAANDLTQVLEYLASEDARKRTVGLVSLQHFFSPDKQEYHLRALSALAAGARLEKNEEVLRALRLAMEQALANVEPGLLQEISWQGVNLSGIDLSHRQLNNLDLRDAVLEDANLSNASLAHAQLVNARLNGANLGAADLSGVDLTYADLAGASLKDANLQGAILSHAKVLRIDLGGADLTGAIFDPEELRWDLIDSWREARLGPDLMARLIEHYGPAKSGPRVLMLLWEMPPLVAGGTWTASYHLVRNLKRTGAVVTVAVPWSEWALSPLPFDTDVTVVSMGIDPPQGPEETDAGPYWSPYARPSWPQESGGPWSPYAAPPWSPYATPAWSPYSWLGPSPPHSPDPRAPGHDVYGWSMGGPQAIWPYSRVSTRAVYHGGSGLLRLMEIYRRRVARLVANEQFDLIHAHDWVTFPAAMDAASRAGISWVGHFHSSEEERHPERPDPVVERLERAAAQNANAIVAPSKGTAKRLIDIYGVKEERVHVVPNSLSREEVSSADMGSFEARRVVYLGRLTRQKGPDFYAAIAGEVQKHRPDVEFAAYGEGEEAARLQASSVRLLGPVDWKARGRAFRNASALVVPSRAEPFGMVVLEAMQHRVPVLYPAESGAAEVLESGFAIEPGTTRETAERLISLLDDWLLWEQTVEAQAKEITAYVDRRYEQELVRIWTSVQGGGGAQASSGPEVQAGPDQGGAVSV